MHLTYTPEQERLRRELQAYFSGLMTPDLRAALQGGDYGDGEAYREVVRQLGRDGWLALSWPAEYGGRDAPMIDQLIFMDEAAAAGVPVPFLTINTVGPTIMRYGTGEQKAFYLPRIAAGEIHFAIGYSEPEAGTDLASLRTRAVRDGQDYVINGQKMWTSLIQYADYVWLACRTDPQAPRHRGLSILIVPTSSAGFSWTPVPTMAGPDDQRDVLLRRPGARLRPGRPGEPGLAADHQPAQSRAGGPHLRGPGPDRAARGVRVGPRHQAGQRPAGHRRRMGPAHPGPGARQDRVPHAGQLADRDAGRCQPGGGLGDQGVRHRVRHRGLPAADGGARRERSRPRRVAGRDPGRADRADAPVRADPDVRRRHQRGTAGHHRRRCPRASHHPRG